MERLCPNHGLVMEAKPEGAFYCQYCRTLFTAQYFLDQEAAKSAVVAPQKTASFPKPRGVL